MAFTRSQNVASVYLSTFSDKKTTLKDPEWGNFAIQCIARSITRGNVAVTFVRSNWNNNSPPYTNFRQYFLFDIFIIFLSHFWLRHCFKIVWLSRLDTVVLSNYIAREIRARLMFMVNVAKFHAKSIWKVSRRISGFL